MTTATSVDSPEVDSSSRRRPRLTVATARDYGIVIFLAVLFVGLSLSTDTFLTQNNLKNLLDGSVPIAMIACAGTIVLIVGGFDLSAGAIFTVAAVVGAITSNSVNPVVGIAAGLVVGCALGLVNGLVCSYGRVNDFVGTLGTQITFAGLATLISGSGLQLISDPSFMNLAAKQFLGFNASTWIMIIVALLCAGLLNLTVYGRHAFGTGGNPTAARLSGLRVNRVKTYAYVLSGGVAALAGLIVAARSLSVNGTSGNSIIFDALAAILVGGNSVLGGEGAIWRTVVGVMILQTIGNGFNLLGIDPLYQQIVNGVIILVAVGADAWARKR